MKGLRKIVLIPTYNERENIQTIVSRVFAEYPDVELWVIDDNSPDGTGDVVRGLSTTYPHLRLITRTAKNGLGEAYKHALRMLQPQGDVAAIVTMDADGSHDPAKIRELLAALETHDLAIGSRYVRGGGGMSDAGLYRNFLSQGGNMYARLILGHGIKDSTAGFVAFRHSALAGIDIDSISSSGYSYQIDFKNKLLEHGHTFTEVPIVFPDRRLGVSKMSGAIISEGILTPWRIAYRRIKDRRRLFKVMLAGLVAALFVFTAFAATYKITESPSVWYDEGIYMQIGSNIAQSGVQGIRLSPTEVVRLPEVTVGFPLTGPLALVFKLFGTGVLQGRLLMALFILLFVAVSYALVRKMFGSTAALWALALLASFAPLYGNGKSVLGEVPGLLFVVLALYFLECAKTAFTPRLWAILVGLAAGLAVATKPYFIILPAALLIGWFFERKAYGFSWKDIGSSIVAFIVPVGTWLWLQFGGSSATSGEIFSRYANPYQYGDIWHIILGNMKGFFEGVGPLYLLVMTAAWIASIWIRRSRGVTIAGGEIAAFSFSVISILAFLRTSGMYRYIFPAQAVSILFFGTSLAIIASLFASSRLSRAAKIAVPTIVAFMAIFGIYQIEFDSWIADSYSATKTAGWEAHFAAMPTLTPVFFYDTPEVAIFDRGTNYYQFMEPAPDLKIGSDQLAALVKGIPAEVIAVTDRMQNIDPKLLAHYRVSSQFYKYSILRLR